MQVTTQYSYIIASTGAETTGNTRITVRGGNRVWCKTTASGTQLAPNVDQFVYTFGYIMIEHYSRGVRNIMRLMWRKNGTHSYWSWRLGALCPTEQCVTVGVFAEWFKGSCDAPTGLKFNNCTLCLNCIDVFCIYLRTNSDLCHLQHKLIGFYNRDEKCLLRGTDWVFK